MEAIFSDVNGAGVMDYVAAWYIKTAQYITDAATNDNNKRIKCAFVSTNSIAQGEQVGILWKELFNRYRIKIHFAHRTFKWGNEAKGNAAVHVVIIGFSNYEVPEKLIYEYENIKGEPTEIKVRNINPYLVEGKDLVITSKNKTICNVPEMAWGNKPVDGGYLLFTDHEKEEFLLKEPLADKFIKPLISAKEFLHGERRWCLWLTTASPTELKQMPFVLERIKKVKALREQSVDEGARKLATRPSQFRDVKTPNNYILIPAHSSENRKYIPFGFFGKDDIAHNSCQLIPNGTFYHFGILESNMHMSWIKYTCGRIKSDYRYSKDIVYNNFPWPESPTEKQIKSVEEAAQKVTDTRMEFPGCSLADLYDPITMPSALVKAHEQLDKAVDLCYRPQPFINETKRMEFLFELYEKYTAGLFGIPIEKKRKKRLAPL